MINSKTEEKKPKTFYWSVLILLVQIICFCFVFTYQLAIKKLNQDKTNTQLFGSASGIQNGMRCEKETKTIYSFVTNISSINVS